MISPVATLNPPLTSYHRTYTTGRLVSRPVILEKKFSHSIGSPIKPTIVLKIPALNDGENNICGVDQRFHGKSFGTKISVSFYNTVIFVCFHSSNFVVSFFILFLVCFSSIMHGPNNGHCTDDANMVYERAIVLWFKIFNRLIPTQLTC